MLSFRDTCLNMTVSLFYIHVWCWFNKIDVCWLYKCNDAVYCSSDSELISLLFKMLAPNKLQHCIHVGQVRSVYLNYFHGEFCLRNVSKYYHNACWRILILTNNCDDWLLQWGGLDKKGLTQSSVSPSLFNYTGGFEINGVAFQPEETVWEHSSYHDRSKQGRIPYLCYYWF